MSGATKNTVTPELHHNPAQQDVQRLKTFHLQIFAWRNSTLIFGFEYFIWLTPGTHSSDVPYYWILRPRKTYCGYTVSPLSWFIERTICAVGGCYVAAKIVEAWRQTILITNSVNWLNNSVLWVINPVRFSRSCFYHFFITFFCLTVLNMIC